MGTVEKGDGWELHLADWRDVDLPRVDAVIEDPPYGERTHAGQRHERRHTRAGNRSILLSDAGLSYDHLTPYDAKWMAWRAAQVCDGWILTMTSHDLVLIYESALRRVGRYVFAPLPIVMPGMNVRLAGDGPSSWAVHLVVSRTKQKKCWSAKPGAYVLDAGAHMRGRGPTPGPVKGHKPLPLMESILRDYTDAGDLVLDRYAGSGTTGIAAIRLGRRFVGFERKPEHFAIAVKRLRAAREQMGLFT